MNRKAAKLQAAVARIGAHIPPVITVTADEVTRPAHLATLRTIGRTSVMMRLSPTEATLTTATIPSLLHP